jgi:hypothetical protein
VPEMVRRSGQLAAAAGLIWLMLWGHQAATHGLTEVNETRLFLGMTWMDSGKFYVLPFSLLLIGFVTLFRARQHPGKVGKTGFVLVVLTLSLIVVGAAMEFWTFPFGSYELTFEEAGGLGGIIQASATVLFAIALIPFGIDISRARIIPWWLIPLVVISAIAGIFLTPANFIPGVGWLLTGLTLWVRRETPGNV